MKSEKTRSKKKGISLIMLVITIIVVIILAVAVILSIANNNPIENAKKAKEANNNAVEKEKIELLKQAKLMKQSLGTKTEDEVNEEIIKANYPDLNYEEDFKNSRGKKVYVGEDEKIKEELQKGLGVLTIKKDILDYVNQITDTSLIVNDCYLTGLVDKSGETPAMYTVGSLLAKLPAGSKIVKWKSSEYIDVDNSVVIGTDFKIQDKDGNDMLYTVFFGETNGDGKCNIIDYAYISKHISNKAENIVDNFRDAVEYATDVNGDKKITLDDAELLVLNLRAGKVAPYADCIDQFRPVTLGIDVM